MAVYERLQGQIISFETSDGIELEGLLCTPVRSKTCVIYIHGMTDTFYGLKITDHVGYAAFANNMNLFAMNTRGAGTITIFQRLREHLTFRTIGTSFENFKDSLLDLDAAIKMLKGYGFKNFILAGHSTGCQKVTYYQSKRNKRSVKGLILLGPADDYNFQIKKLGFPRWKKWLEVSRKLVRSGRGRELMLPEVDPCYFSAKRYYDLYRPGSLEGNIFNYEGQMHVASRVKVPVLSIFGSEEEFAAMPVSRMLKILSEKFKNPHSKFVSIKGADHCFCMKEEEVESVVSKWLKKLIF